MGPKGFFFDIANRYAGLDAKNDPLVKIDEVIPWQDFPAASRGGMVQAGRGAEVAGGPQGRDTRGLGEPASQAVSE